MQTDLHADLRAARRSRAILCAELFARPLEAEAEAETAGQGPDILLAALLREGEAADARGALDLLLGRLGAPIGARR